jgi:signal-transduction protein with cAMP-binding, CBS, and nucleotidyltransferase domain
MAARQVLDKTDLFGALPPELLAQLRDRTTLERLRRGDVIFEKADAATALYIVFSGRVAIAAKSTDGRESARCRCSTGGGAARRPGRSRPRTSSRSRTTT